MNADKQELQGAPSAADEKEIEGGDITFPGQSLEIKKREAETARKLAFILILILAGFIGLHHLVVVMVALWAPGSSEVLKPLQDAYSAGLPVLSGLADAATGYYFKR